MWTWTQTDGWLIAPGGERFAQGYSGHGPGLNNPRMQSVHLVGPLPCGLYTIEAPIDTVEHGPYFLALTPDPANQMFGRGDFGIHGDEILHPGQHLASEGCIILLLYYRCGISLSPDHRLQVVA